MLLPLGRRPARQVEPSQLARDRLGALEASGEGRCGFHDPAQREPAVPLVGIIPHEWLEHHAIGPHGRRIGRLGVVIGGQGLPDRHLIGALLVPHGENRQQRRAGAAGEMDGAGGDAKRPAQEFGVQGAPAGFGDGDRNDVVAGQGVAEPAERRARIVVLDHHPLAQISVLDRGPERILALTAKGDTEKPCSGRER